MRQPLAGRQAEFRLIFFSSRRRHTRSYGDWSSDVCSSDLVHEVANEAEDLHFHGGQFGIMARKPSPAWQFTLIDSTCDGQREAAIRENEAGLTLVHDEFRNVPTAVSIDPHYSDQLWIKDSRFEHITGPAVWISNDASRMTEINFENIICSHVPIFAKLRESGREFRQAADNYQV